MSTHFSANQYENAFAPTRLQNWQVPKNYKERPSSFDGFTKPIANDRGHILPGVPRSMKSPWGEFVGTWEMPKRPLNTQTMKTKGANTKTVKERTPSPKDCQVEKMYSPEIPHSPARSPDRLLTPQQVRSPQADQMQRQQSRQSPQGERVVTPVSRHATPTSPTQKKATPTSPVQKVATPTSPLHKDVDLA